ncbi:hypothetical protein VHUM_01933 [Vanrija humicola]|uniref:Diacetyl reductase [(S)-acetoin forming] n=1 Tax=Vanrija humicola TaxID=5417 RepID=A0A7D8ZB32_VANHU|nr:hypothetical protein VHUM_01933 [Vanrija humicola]
MPASQARRVAIVTGAAQGIGRAIALRLAKDGFDLALADLKPSRGKLDAVAAEVQALGAKTAQIDCDVRSEADVYALVEGAVAALGDLDVMIANAGIAPAKMFLDNTTEFMDNLYQINVRGVMYCYQAAAKQMIKQGHGGKLIAACSISGITTTEGQSAYCATKFAVRALNQGAAIELGKHGITANVYCPGPVLTDMWAAIDKDMAKEHGAKEGELSAAMAKRSPLGRNAEPEDIAALVSFLAGPDSGYITAQAIQSSVSDTQGSRADGRAGSGCHSVVQCDEI